jgi:hypothetical protein
VIQFKRSREVRFKIGDAFPAEKPLARWAAVVAMALNDVLYVNSRIIDPDAPPEQHMFYLRLAASQSWEFAEFVRDTRRWWPEVDEFLASLPASVQADLETLLAPLQQSHPAHARLQRLRNMIFHYPQVHPHQAQRGVEPLEHAMREAAELEGQIVAGKRLGATRALFADEIAVNLMGTSHDVLVELLQILRPVVQALLRFCEAALNAYLRGLDDSVFFRKEG